MERSQSKFIYDFLPWNTFNHAHNNLSGRIGTLKPELNEYGQEVTPDLPKNYLISRIHRHISKWPNADAIRDDLTYANTELVKPGWANYFVYPLTFECDACKSVTKFSRDQMDEMTEEGNDARYLAICQNPHCGETLSDRDQLPFVAICECGAIDELNVPTCCDAGMQFRRPTTQMSSWHWSCAVNSGCDNKSFWDTPVFCPNGDCDNRNLEVMNHTSSSAFYPQVRNLINVQPRLDDLHSSDHYQAQIVSDCLLGDEGGEVDEHEKRRVANNLLDGDFFNAPREEVEEKMKEAEEQLMVDVQGHREDTETWLQGNDPDSEKWWPSNGYEGDPTTLAEELYEFLSVVSEDYAPASGIESISYQEMVDNDAEDTHLSLPKVRKYNNLRENLNFSEVRLIKDYPITAATYGYTRTDANPPGENRNPAEAHAEEDGRYEEGEGNDGDRPVQLNLFRTGDYSAPQILAQTNDAEAVLVQFDLEKVMAWLDENDLLDEPSSFGETVSLPDTDDAEAMRKWFVTHIIPPGRYDELDDESAPGTPECITRHCYTLLNTTAHLFINGMGALAGHQRESLVEHLMPRTMSFVIYKRPDTNFALGSLWTLFEEQFDDFAGHLNELYDCSYDPVCIHDENGACEDCLYLAAISTENANHNLGRGTFYGGNFDGRNLTGYRDINLDDGND